MVKEIHVMKLPRRGFHADVASLGSLELGSACCHQGRIIFTHFVLQDSAIPFRGFMAELLLLLGVSTSKQQPLQSTGAKLGGKKFAKWTYWKDGTELFRMTLMQICVIMSLPCLLLSLFNGYDCGR